MIGLNYHMSENWGISVIVRTYYALTITDIIPQFSCSGKYLKDNKHNSPYFDFYTCNLCLNYIILSVDIREL